tara:strand:- start:20 stop:421 length:402 start_codon:yes stop_codon:yes gene_type:complete
MLSPFDISKQANNNIISAAIKMMLIDGRIDSREINKIIEIYYLLFKEKITNDKVRELIFEVIALDDFGCDVSVIGKTIADSINSKRSKELATIALAEVMVSDLVKHEAEQELILQITDLWGTQDILQDYLNDN